MKPQHYIGSAFTFLASLLFYVTVIASSKSKNEYPYQMKVYYSDSTGIKIGTDVYVLGIKKGFVSALDVIDANEATDTRFLNPNLNKAIEVTISLSEPLTLWDNYEIKFNTKTLFAGRYIDINPGKSQVDLEENYFVAIPTREVAFFKPSFTEKEKLPDYFPSARYYDDFFMGATGILKENSRDLREIILSLASISDKLNQPRGALSKFINEEKTMNELDEVILDAKMTMREGRRYQESSRNLEGSIPIPITIRASFWGRTTLSGTRVGTQTVR